MSIPPAHDGPDAEVCVKKSTFAASSRIREARHWDKENLALARTATWLERTAHRLRLTPFECGCKHRGVAAVSRAAAIASAGRSAVGRSRESCCLAVSVGGAPRPLKFLMRRSVTAPLSMSRPRVATWYLQHGREQEDVPTRQSGASTPVDVDGSDETAPAQKGLHHKARAAVQMVS